MQPARSASDRTPAGSSGQAFLRAAHSPGEDHEDYFFNNPWLILKSKKLRSWSVGQNSQDTFTAMQSNKRKHSGLHRGPHPTRNFEGKKNPKHFLHIKLVFKRSSSHRNNPALRSSQLWSMYLPTHTEDPQVHSDPSVNTDTTPWLSQPVALQWGWGRKVSGFEQGTQGHSLDT